jgi:hypothetical protein
MAGDRPVLNECSAPKSVPRQPCQSFLAALKRRKLTAREVLATDVSPHWDLLQNQNTLDGSEIIPPMFRVGDLLHNKSSGEDGRVVSISFEDDTAFYEVSISGDRTSAVQGSRVSHWPECEVEASSVSH